MASKFKTYDVLRKRLSNAGFKVGGKYCRFSSAGSIANYLLNLFLSDDITIVEKKELINYKIIKKDDNTTNELLKALHTENFIRWESNENFEKYKKERFRYLILSFINLTDLVEKELGEQKATKKDVFNLKLENESLKNDINLINNRINKLEKSIISIINKFDPPFTEEKYNKYVDDN